MSTGRHTNWISFRQAIEAQLGTMSESNWELLKELLSAASVHPPCNEADVQYAITKLKRLQEILHHKENGM